MIYRLYMIQQWTQRQLVLKYEEKFKEVLEWQRKCMSIYLFITLFELWEWRKTLESILLLRRRFFYWWNMKLHTIGTILILISPSMSSSTSLHLFSFQYHHHKRFLNFHHCRYQYDYFSRPLTTVKLPLMASNILIAAGTGVRKRRSSSVLWMSPVTESQIILFGRQRGIAFSCDNSGSFYRDKDANRKAKLIKVDVSRSTQEMSYERVLRWTTESSSFESIGRWPQSLEIISPLFFPSSVTRRDRKHQGIIRVFTFNSRIFNLKNWFLQSIYSIVALNAIFWVDKKKI